MPPNGEGADDGKQQACRAAAAAIGVVSANSEDWWNAGGMSLPPPGRMLPSGPVLREGADA